MKKNKKFFNIAKKGLKAYYEVNKNEEVKYMKNKLETLCTVSVVLSAVVCMAVNFNAAFNNLTPNALNMVATVFFLLFWILILRFAPAAKISSILSLSVMIGAIIGFCSVIAGWNSGIVKILLFLFVFPPKALFYGVNFLVDDKILYIFIAIFAFVILIFSLITLVNKKTKPENYKKTESTGEVLNLDKNIQSK